MSRPVPSTRDAYRWFCPITTRWHDNDIYGHVNNVTYYSYFDTVANTYLIEQGGLDIHHGDTVGFVVNSGCNYFAPIAFPDKLDGGLRVNKLGKSSGKTQRWRKVTLCMSSSTRPPTRRWRFRSRFDWPCKPWFEVAARNS
jgi:acyl-CoA thioesterase FadM